MIIKVIAKLRSYIFKASENNKFFRRRPSESEIKTLKEETKGCFQKKISKTFADSKKRRTFATLLRNKPHEATRGVAQSG